MRAIDEPSSLAIHPGTPTVMARTLIKLPCGIIHTPEFASHLEQIHAHESPRHRHEVLALDYIRCGTGPQKGAAWLQLAWIAHQSAPVANRHRIGNVEVFIHRQSARGLEGRCLHCENGKITVMS